MNPSAKHEMSGIAIHLNGDYRSIPASFSLQELIDELCVDLKQVAVELNQRIVPRSQLADVTLQPDDRVEIVEFIGGG